MAHREQWVFCGKVKQLFPESFINKKVLDIGSFDVNGNEEFLFEDCNFTGLDIGPGDGVDVVCPAQEYDAPDETFDTIISCECWEHNPYYKESIVNAVRMLKKGGLFFFSCATTGRPRQCNWMDIERLRRASNVNGVQSMVINKMDILRELGQWTLRSGKETFSFDTEQEFKNYIVDQLPNVELYFSGSPHGFKDVAYSRSKAVA